jgi:hypothetical protein
MMCRQLPNSGQQAQREGFVEGRNVHISAQSLTAVRRAFRPRRAPAPLVAPRVCSIPLSSHGLHGRLSRRHL